MLKERQRRSWLTILHGLVQIGGVRVPHRDGLATDRREQRHQLVCTLNRRWISSEWLVAPSQLKDLALHHELGFGEVRKNRRYLDLLFKHREVIGHTPLREHERYAFEFATSGFH